MMHDHTDLTPPHTQEGLSEQSQAHGSAQYAYLYVHTMTKVHNLWWRGQEVQW